jgi:hypothetical protein
MTVMIEVAGVCDTVIAQLLVFSVAASVTLCMIVVAAVRVTMIAVRASSTGTISHQFVPSRPTRQSSLA